MTVDWAYGRMLLVTLAGITGAGCGAERDVLRAPVPPDPVGVVRAYYDAYDARDGAAICAHFIAPLRARYDRALADRGFDCALMIGSFIGYGEESYTPTFRRAEVLDARAVVAGHTAAVHVRARVHYDSFDPEERVDEFGDVVYLRVAAGRWRVVKPGRIVYAAMSAFQIPSSVTDPPIDAQEAARAAPQHRASFSCGGREIKRFDDAFDDVAQDPRVPSGAPAATLDLRGVRATADRLGNVCFVVTFVRAPSPGTAVRWVFEQDIGASGRFVYRLPEVRIGHAGRLYIGEAVGEAAAGWIDGALVLRLARSRRLDGRRPLRLSAYATSQQREEPLISAPQQGIDRIEGDASF